MSDILDQQQAIFYTNQTLRYQVSGQNGMGAATPTQIEWQLAGPCGSASIYTDTVSIPPGAWTHTFTTTTPACVGAYTATVAIDTAAYSTTLQTGYQRHFASAAQVSTDQAFDRCYLPSVSQMQAWWVDSPYMVFNIYLGGIHYPCPLNSLTPSWVQAVAQQGWDFILTWVGPQAACSNFIHKMSSDPTTAYQQGIAEAAAALHAAANLGLSGQKIIYYDLEAYSAPADQITACRTAADAFIQGWTDWIKLQGDKAGVYGSPCNSYMTDWANNNPPPDDVWIAHWLLPAKFRADATVWDVACMSNSYWPNNQRLRQYAGDHSETWGGVSLTIDSNILGGDITAVAAADADRTPETVPADILEMTWPEAQVGYLRTETEILKTWDGGARWQTVSPALANAAFLDMQFLDSHWGWFVVQQAKPGFDDFLAVYHTQNGGLNWKFAPIPVDAGTVAVAQLNFVGQQNGWLHLKLKTGSSFSLGRLFTTQNGGLTWEERTVPSGGGVEFVDLQRGWAVSGPLADQLYATVDGAKTWQPVLLPDLPAEPYQIGLPQFATPRQGWLPLTVAGESPRLLIYQTGTDGSDWQLSDTYEIAAGITLDSALQFSPERWWLAAPDGSTIQLAQKDQNRLETVASAGLPVGAYTFDFVSPQLGWAIVESSLCTGPKRPAGQASLSGGAPRICSAGSRLFATSNGGQTWRPVNIWP